MERKMKWMSLILAVIMMISCTGVCAEEVILAEVNGVQITQSEVEEYLIYYYYYGYIDDYSDYTGMVNMLIDYTLEIQMLTDLGFFNFTEEEEEAIRNDALNEKEELIEEYVSYYLSEDSDEAREALYAQATDYYDGYENDIYSDLLNQAAYDKWYVSVTGDTVTDEAVRAAFDSYVAEDEAQYKDDITSYEIDYYYGYTQFYMPEGYRRVLRILINADETLMDAYTQAQAAWEETLDEENNPTGSTAEATEKLSDAKQAILNSVKEKTDDVYAALESGADIADVIALYGEDPYMTEEYGGLVEGYPVHRESILYDNAFVRAAFGEDMTAPGAYTAPAVCDDGVNILFYLADIPSGAVELTDEMYTDIKSYLEEMSMENILSSNLEEYRQNSVIVINTDAIEAAENALN